MRRAGARWLLALWVAVGLALLAVTIAVILPPLLSADYHRAAIEALASRLTGRDVVIDGRIGLSMVPAPQLTAAGIHIDVPKGERISARSLRIDLAPRDLLFGRLRATRLTLQSPRIVLPWPLPEGAASILPPPWLSSLHAKVEDGTITLGRLTFSHADLSIFTGGRNAVLAASGTGVIFGMPVSATLHLDGTSATGAAPITASLSTPTAELAQQKAGLSFRGTLDQASRLTGTLAGSAQPALLRSLPFGPAFPAAPAHFTAAVTANPRMVSLADIRFDAGKAGFQGNGRIDLVTGMPSLTLTGHDIDATPILRLFAAGEQPGPISLHAVLSGTRLDTLTGASLYADIEAGTDSTAIHELEVGLSGGARIGLHGTIGPAGLHGRFTLAAPAPAALLDAASRTVPAIKALPPLTVPVRLAGQVSVPREAGGGLTIRLRAMQGSIGSSSLSTGALTAELGPPQAAAHTPPARRIDAHASLAFARLDATPFLALVTDPAPQMNHSAFDLSLTAAQARLGALQARRLLLDVRLADTLSLRAFDFFAISPRQKQAALVVLRGERGGGKISHATLLVNGPDAADAIPLLRPMARLGAADFPKPLFGHPFAASLTASGPVKALAVDAAVTIGEMRLRAQPEVNLVNRTLKGPLSFQMPDATALTKPWDPKAGLAWPGAGSVGLRTDFAAAPRHVALPNFVLSFGALTASGHLALDCAADPCRLSGLIAADTLVLPPDLLRIATAPHWLAVAIPDFTASHIRLGQQDIATGAALDLEVTPQALTLGIKRATIAGGTLTGKAELNAANGATPPSLNAGLDLAKANAASLAGLFDGAGLPIPLSAGTLDLALSAKATGYTAKTWAATLAGTLTGSGNNLTLQGIDLAKAAAASPSGLRSALLSGSTSFDAGSLAANAAAGAFTITKVTLDGAQGAGTLSGSIDLPDQSLAVTADLQPKPSEGPAPAVTLSLTGPWKHPKRIITEAPAAP